MGVSEGLDALAAMVDAGADAATLKTAIEAIRENDLREASVNAPASSRARISAEEMSSEVVGSNPYSRLMALQRMGIVHEYKKIRDKAVAVVGVGGVGSVAAEMLARCGVGRLQLYDFDTVELANMNRLFFRPEHAGMTKTDAAKSTLYDINPDVQCQSYHLDVTTMTGFETFRESLVDPGDWSLPRGPGARVRGQLRGAHVRQPVLSGDEPGLDGERGLGGCRVGARTDDEAGRNRVFRV